LGELGGVLDLLPVNPSQCPFVQMTDTGVAFLLYCRSCPCNRHDLYLPSIPASLQTLGRGECVAASALAPHGLRIISPLTSYLNFLGAIWTFDKNKLALSFPPIHPPSRPRACQTLGPIPIVHTCIYHHMYIYVCIYKLFFFPTVCQTLGPSNSHPPDES
jgi:hypothetical protein